MATGDSLGSWDSLSQRPSTSGSPTYLLVLDDLLLGFANDADNTTYFGGVMPQTYTGGDLEVHLFWTPGDDSGVVKWDVAFERRELTVYVVDDGPAFGTATTQSITATADYVLIETVFLITAANAGTIVAGEPFRISIKRDTSVGSNMAEYALLSALELVEA